MSVLIRTSPHAWRRMAFFQTQVVGDDYAHVCALCRQRVRVGEMVVSQRSAHEQTPRCYGPIEHMYHLEEWIRLNGIVSLPPLGRDKEVYMKFDAGHDSYPWEGRW